MMAMIGPMTGISSESASVAANSSAYVADVGVDEDAEQVEPDQEWHEDDPRNDRRPARPRAEDVAQDLQDGEDRGAEGARHRRAQAGHQPRAVGQGIEDEKRDRGPGDDEGHEPTHAGGDDAEQAAQEVRYRAGQPINPRSKRGLHVLWQPEATQELADHAGDLRQAADESRQLVEEGVENEVDEGDDGGDQREHRDQRATPPGNSRPLQAVDEPVHQEDEDQGDDVRRQCLLREDDQHRQPDEDAAEDHRVPGRWKLNAPRGAWRGGGSGRDGRRIDQANLRTWFGAPVV